MSDARLQFTVHKARWTEGSPGETIEVPFSGTPLKSTHNTVVWQTQYGKESVYFKVYRHRTLSASIGHRFTRCRAEREYDRLSILDDAHVPCSEPLCYGLGKNGDHGRFEIVGTREIPFAHQFRRYLSECSDANKAPDLANLFDVIYQQHKAGVYHGSLNQNNIVMSCPPEGDASFYIVDLPRAIDFPYDISQTEMAWYDLVHFVHRTAPAAGLERCLGILDVYGYDADKKKQFVQFLATYQPSKQMRYRLKNKFGLKAWWAKRGRND